jgi:glycosyltransferase involved in cell wall biosynthesis
LHGGPVYSISRAMGRRFLGAIVLNPRPVRVLHVAPSFYPALVYGGPTHSTYNLCRAVARQGCEVRVLTTDANGARAVLDVDRSRDVTLFPNLSVRYCPRIGRESLSPTFLRLLPEYLRWAEVVHLMAVYSPPTIPTLLAAHALRRPVVWSPRGMLQRWEASRNRRLKDAWDQVCRLVAARDTTLLFTSREEADESNARFGGFPWEIIPNGVDLPERVAHVGEEGAIRLVFLGRLHPIKGLENLLAGFARYRHTTKLRATLTLAGSGEADYVASLRAKIAELGLGDHVEMPGSVDGEAKTALFAHADVVLVPSFRESFSIVVIEALGHEVPVIAARGTPWKRLEDEGCGLWVDNDPASLAAAMERIEGMPRRAMGEKGRALVEREYTWDLVGRETVALYRGLIARGRGSV